MMHDDIGNALAGGGATAEDWLRKAIERHKRHMNGKEPTDKDSQEQMMHEMKMALSVLLRQRGT